MAIISPPPGWNFPKLGRLRCPQGDPDPALETLSRLEEGLTAPLQEVRPGQTVGLAIGSRGLDRLPEVVTRIIQLIRQRKAQVVLIPAMGSHGGGTPEGQVQVLRSLGLDAQALQVDIQPGLETTCVGTSRGGRPLITSTVAQCCDHLILVNRIKPHTDFTGNLGSGLRKMLVVGLGKREGAMGFHAASARHGYESVLLDLAEGLRERLPLLCGVALRENAAHQLAEMEVALPRHWPEVEARMLEKANQSLARLPMEDIDILVLDQIGKNVSGAGMDPNVVGRSIHGYTTLLSDMAALSPRVRRLIVLGLTPETGGNAIGLGLADFVAERVVRAMDPVSTYLNSLTALSLQACKIPMQAATDQELLHLAFASLNWPGPETVRLLRVRNTLQLDEAWASPACLEPGETGSSSEWSSPPCKIEWTPEGNLNPW